MSEEMLTCDQCKKARPESQWPTMDAWLFCPDCDYWIGGDGYCYGCTFCPPSYSPSGMMGDGE